MRYRPVPAPEVFCLISGIANRQCEQIKGRPVSLRADRQRPEIDIPCRNWLIAEKRMEGKTDHRKFVHGQAVGCLKIVSGGTLPVYKGRAIELRDV